MRWYIVEQAKLMEYGKREFEEDSLTF